jgi:hypothetical protein
LRPLNKKGVNKAATFADYFGISLKHPGFKKCQITFGGIERLPGLKHCLVEDHLLPGSGAFQHSKSGGSQQKVKSIEIRI